MATKAKTEAEAKYAKAQIKAREAKQVLSEVAAEAKRVSDNTARLRALRLARDAREAEEAAAAPPVAKAKKKKAAAKPVSAGKLAAANDE